MDTVFEHLACLLPKNYRKSEAQDYVLQRIGENILKKGAERGFYRQLAFRMEVRPEELERIMSGEIFPSKSTVADLMECLKLGPEIIPFNETLSVDVYKKIYCRVFLEKPPQDAEAVRLRLKRALRYRNIPRKS